MYHVLLGGASVACVFCFQERILVSAQGRGLVFSLAWHQLTASLVFSHPLQKDWVFRSEGLFANTDLPPFISSAVSCAFA